MRPRPRVMIVDDDKTTREGLGRALGAEYEVLLVESGERALALMRETPVDILLSDVRMPGMDGMALLERARALNPQPLSIMFTAYGTVEIAVEAMKRGAYDFLMKPINLDHLEILLRRALRSRDVEAENLSLREELNDRYGLESILGNSPPMLEVFDIIKQAAPSQATILLQGASGTGKELVAHAIHRLSPRRDGPFVAVHSAALAPTLLESELFGHEKGAYTGAAERRCGRFEMADGGTLFLDEISEIDPAIQIKLLRVLEERKFERVGGSVTIDVDIRLIAATNRDLKALVAEGKFRQDLFFRLDVVSILLPPLCERQDDIALLSHHFLRDFAKANGKAVDGFTPDALQILGAYSWPGNVRELRNAIERMVVLSRNNRLTARDLPPAIRNGVHLELEKGTRRGPGLSRGGHEGGTLSEMEKAMIDSALRRNRSNRTKAAQQLGISRRTLQRKLKELAMTPEGESASLPERSTEKSPSSSSSP